MTSFPQLAEHLERGASLAKYFQLPDFVAEKNSLVGSFSSKSSGSSLDFHDHRLYYPGDDIRHLDWNAYARSGQYNVKLFRADVIPSVDIVLDHSASLHVTKEKSELVQQLLGLFVELVLRAGSKPRIQLLREKSIDFISPERLFAGDLPEFSSQIEQSSIPDSSLLELPRNSIRLVISDLLFEGNPLIWLAPFRHSSSSPLHLFVPFDSSEVRPDWQGSLELVDVETMKSQMQHLSLNDLEEYYLAYERHFNLWRECCLKNQVEMLRLDSSKSLAENLLQKNWS